VDTAADTMARFEDCDVVSGSGQGAGSGKAGGARADDEDVRGIHGIRVTGNRGTLCASGLDQAGANGVADHAGGFVHAELFENAAAVGVSGLITDAELLGSLLGGFAIGDQDEDLAFALGEREDQADGVLIRSEDAVLAIVNVGGAAQEASEFAGAFIPGRAGVLDPPVGASVALEPVLHAEGLAGGETFQICFETEVAVLGVNALEPAIA